MAYKNKIITNAKTGQVIQYINSSSDTSGEMLEMEATYPPFSREPPSHYHPSQEEFFTVLSGELTVRIDHHIQKYQPGSLIHILPGKTHSMWNNSNKPAVVNWKVYPALDTEYFLETATGLANDDRTDDDGVPPLLQLFYLLKTYNKSFRLAKPSLVVQRILFTIASPLFILAGYKKRMRKYLN
ncbi:cupin domain-containing protein [Pedobacter sp. HMF7647]|uniref:Cupin domain-containing protein n=1 Tax=Hufsiella arboris TaxID=2695275 RepID=A0A7K1YE95_9SPHI|nr:cupin domain-containing protein [Hufsiella arboris]MXV52902.1 cupin domain-containing protein [Hufsiella arboris]